VRIGDEYVGVGDSGDAVDQVEEAGGLADDERLVARQALAGMLSSKQYYALDLERWLAEHGADPLGGGGWPCNQSWPDLPGRSW
jgi:hypothetical protein